MRRDSALTAPTRVAYLTGEYPRATDVWIQREVAGLRRRGVVVQTFAARRTGDEHMVGPEQVAERDRTIYLVPRIASHRLLVDHALVLARGPRRYARALGLAWRTRRPGLDGAFRQIMYFLEAGLLAAELRRRDLPHLHNHFADSSCTVAMLTSALGGITFSFTVHGLADRSGLHEWAVPEKLCRADFCVCVSEAGRRQLLAVARADTEPSVHVVHCGVEVDDRPVVTHDRLGEHLLFVGRLDVAKGVDVLLDALALVRRDHPAVRLTVVGDGPHRGHLEERARAVGVDDAVTFVGYLARADVAEVMSTADVFVLPSFAEGIPVTLVEAFTLGIPVVATDVGGTGELVVDGVNGHLVDAGDAAALAERIVALVQDPATRARLGAAGRRKVREEFDLDEQVRRLHDLFARTRPGPDDATGVGRARTQPGGVDGSASARRWSRRSTDQPVTTRKHSPTRVAITAPLQLRPGIRAR